MARGDSNTPGFRNLMIMQEKKRGYLRSWYTGYSCSETRLSALHLLFFKNKGAPGRTLWGSFADLRQQRPRHRVVGLDLAVQRRQ